MRKGSLMFGMTDGHGVPLVEWCLRSIPSVTAPGWFTCYCGCGYVGVMSALCPSCAVVGALAVVCPGPATGRIGRLSLPSGLA